MNGKTILLVEDEKKVQDFNKRLLAGEGFAVQTAMTLADARGILGQRAIDAIILDIGMPDGNGLDFLKELRQTSNIPVLMLTGYGENADVEKGFDSGCDDYLPKPYTFNVLHARLKRLLYRVDMVPETVSRGPLTLNILAKEAFMNGEDLLLTPKDFALLQYFIQNEDRPLTAETLYEKIWGRPINNDVGAARRAVSRLRKKIEGCGYIISNVYGNGYRFEEEANSL